MLAEIPTEELARTLEEVAGNTLSKAGIREPPIDALCLAKRLGLAVAWDDRQASRARLVQFAGDQNLDVSAVFVRHDPRHERLQWAIAHEVGELLAETVFTKLLIDPSIAPPHCRETIANGLASRLLLPNDLFSADAVACGWDLFELKSRYATASHELIARRMLDFLPPVIITVFDNNCLTWRKANLPCRAPKRSRREFLCRNAAHESSGHRFEPGPPQISAWAIHEPDWKREILRLEVDEFTLETDSFDA
jgi:Zn-dependent peptidase ImmA (M78 family)